MEVTLSSCPPGVAELTQVYKSRLHALVKIGAQLGSYKRRCFTELDPERNTISETSKL